MKYLLFFLFFIICFYRAFSQPNMTLYQMHDIPQSNSLNPAVSISCGWIVSFPGLGGISVGASSPLSYNNLGAGQDVLNVNDFISHLHNKNVFSTTASINLLTIGYRYKNTYFQFSVNERFSQVSTIYQDPVVMLLRGNSGYINQVVKGAPSINALHYREYAFNVAKEIQPLLWVGGRAKLLFGRLNARSINNTVDFYTSFGTYDLTLTTNALIRASVPGKVTLNSTSGKVSDFESDIKVSDFIFNPSNVGIGLDLGFIKNYQNRLQLSASLLNIGLIRWTDNLHTFKQNGTLTFNGPFSAINELDALIDTLKSFTRLDYVEGESYTQMVSPMFMAGVNYPVVDYLNAGITVMGEIQPNAFPWSVTVTGFSKGLPVVDLGMSYTVNSNSFFNVGFGLGAHLGVFDLHLLADNFMALIKPFNARYATIQFGINFRFGCKNNRSGDEPPSCPAYRSSITPENQKMVPCIKKSKKK